ncbi:MAG TPA: GNAT family N-acetyltransferase [Beijerinckiaceae bacterium]|nr:GNAT family N-acetyltransferase [Beijerinckiaceae bacterium]
MTDDLFADGRLRGGVIRRLWRADLEHYRAHLLRLDPQTRRDRFSGAVADDFLDRYAERAFAEDRILIGYFAGAELRGVAELYRFAPPHGGEGEAAFSVETAHRLRGVGTALFRRLLLAARNRGIRTIHVRCLPHNRAMQALARRHGARVSFEGGETQGQVEARPATPFSVMQEWADLGFELTRAALRAQLGPTPAPAMRGSQC